MATDCKYKITLKLKEAFEDTNGIWRYHINIPCGKCARCIERRKMEWGFRMKQEMDESKTAYFVTLTYAPETVPYTSWGIKTLLPHKDVTHLVKKKNKKRKVREQKDDLQLFFKRLRQNQKRSKPTIEHLRNNLGKKDKIKYYAAGEYGEERNRPHYHAIIFNASMINIEKSWELGTTHIVPANEMTIAYVMKYLDKRLDKEPDWKKTPEYNTMSEGIGKSYIDKNKSWHKRNPDILYVTTRIGIKIPMPKYYREKIFTEEERKEQVKIVTERMDEIKIELTQELGLHRYVEVQNMEGKESERRFKKKIKKRNID